MAGAWENCVKNCRKKSVSISDLKVNFPRVATCELTTKISILTLAKITVAFIWEWAKWVDKKCKKIKKFEGRTSSFVCFFKGDILFNGAKLRKSVENKWSFGRFPKNNAEFL